jgi:nucleoside-diphosphate-sugar epimerase
MEQRKRVAVIGHTGTIGKHVVEALKLYKDSDGKSQFEIVPAGRRECDISDTKSISCFFQKDGKNLDAVISCAGSQFWGTLDKLDREGLNVGFQNKLGGTLNPAIR